MFQLKTTRSGGVDEHSRPLALAAIGAPVVDAPAGPLLEHRLLDVDTEHVVLARLDAVHLLGASCIETASWASATGRQRLRSRAHAVHHHNVSQAVFDPVADPI